MGDSPNPKLKEQIKRIIRSAGKFKNLWQYLMFVALAGLFWFIMALNDNTQSDFQVKVEIVDVPDSITFITDPPVTINVTVHNKGTMLLRRKLLGTPVIKIPFSEFASHNKLLVTPSAMMNRLRSIFGESAGISINSADSISVQYSTRPGKTVPVRVNYDVTAALGKVVNGSPKLNVRDVRIFSVDDIIDTIMYVSTMPIVRRNLSESLKMRVNLKPIKGVKIEPSYVDVTIPIEPLENRKIFVPVIATGVPAGETLSLFPPKVEVAYLVPMSMSEDMSASSFTVIADYADIAPGTSSKIKVKMGKIPEGVENATLEVDSIDYTIIREIK